MSDTLFGFEVQPDDKEEQTTYSRNRLTNGDAEMQSTAGWQATNAQVVPGGVEDSQWVFELAAENGEMKQAIPISGAQPPDYKIRGIFLPGDVISDVATQVKIFGKAEVKYAIGEDDEVIIPVMEPMAYKPIGR